MDDRGVILGVVVISLMMMTMLAQLSALLVYNQNRVLKMTSGQRILSYYRSQAGTVDAAWRIRKNIITNLSAQAGTLNFGDSTFDPAPYGLDIDANPPQVVAVDSAQSDVTVNIGAMGANGLRSISSKGKESF